MVAMNIQNFAALQGITKFSDLKVNDQGTLTKQNSINALFQKIGDHFKNMSFNGKANIASRNEAIFAKLNALVTTENVENQTPAQQRQAISAKFEQVVTQSKNIFFKACIQKHFSSNAINEKTSDTQQKIKKSVKVFAERLLGDPEMTSSIFQDKMDRLVNVLTKNLQGSPAEGKDFMRNQLTEVFNTQQGKIQNNIHASFEPDANRSMISNIGETPIKGNMPRGSYNDSLLTFLKDNENLAPFLSMAASQAGLTIAQKLFPEIGGLDHTAEMPYLGTQKPISAQTPINSMSITKDDKNIIIRYSHQSHTTGPEIVNDIDNSRTKGSIFSLQKLNLEMTIPLNQKTNAQNTVNGVFTPEYSISNINLSSSALLE